MKAIGLGKHWRGYWHTKHVHAKEKIMACVVQWLDKTGRFEDLGRGIKPSLGMEMERILRGPFEHAILQLHLFTDYKVRALTDEANLSCKFRDTMDVCEQISDYMLYLLVVKPSLLPVSTTALDILALFPEKIFYTKKEDENIRSVLHKDWTAGGPEGKILLGVRSLLDYPQSDFSSIDDLFEEIKETWIRLLVYAGASPALNLMHNS